MNKHEQIALYQAQRDAALAVVRDIDSGNAEYFEIHDHGRVNVTSDMRRYHQDHADRLDGLARAWERLAP